MTFNVHQPLRLARVGEGEKGRRICGGDDVSVEVYRATIRRICRHDCAFHRDTSPWRLGGGFDAGLRDVCFAPPLASQETSGSGRARRRRWPHRRHPPDVLALPRRGRGVSGGAAVIDPAGGSCRGIPASPSRYLSILEYIALATHFTLRRDASS